MQTRTIIELILRNHEVMDAQMKALGGIRPSPSPVEQLGGADKEGIDENSANLLNIVTSGQMHGALAAINLISEVEGRIRKKSMEEGTNDAQCEADIIDIEHSVINE